MKLPENKPALFVYKRSELALNQTAMAQLLKGFADQKSSLRFKAKGFSMFPFIRDGDLVTIGPNHNNSLSLGDVVAFVHPETKGLVVHRIVKRKGTAYHLKGDNSLDGDGLIDKNNLLGQVRRVERSGKRIRFGFGPEKICIALMTRSRLLLHFISFVMKVFVVFRLQGSYHE